MMVRAAGGKKGSEQWEEDEGEQMLIQWRGKESKIGVSSWEWVRLKLYCFLLGRKILCTKLRRENVQILGFLWFLLLSEKFVYRSLPY